MASVVGLAELASMNRRSIERKSRWWRTNRRTDDGDRGVVGNDEARYPANSCKGARVDVDPIAERLRPGDQYVSEVTATMMWAWCTSPVNRSTITGTVSPA